MSPVGGSRHYQGGGLGQVGIWGCPSCGADNTGPLEQGCSSCGAGKPTRTMSAPTSPTPPPPAAAAPEEGQVRPGDVADVWASDHPEVVSIAEAYRAGYLAGVRAAQAAQQAARAAQQASAAAAASAVPVPDAKAYRTMVAALSLFRDQVLAGHPEEVTSGEWLSAEEATTVISQLVELLGPEMEGVHAVHA
jgi:hypothetical protein